MELKDLDGLKLKDAQKDKIVTKTNTCIEKVNRSTDKDFKDAITEEIRSVIANCLIIGMNPNEVFKQALEDIEGIVSTHYEDHLSDVQAAEREAEGSD